MKLTDIKVGAVYSQTATHGWPVLVTDHGVIPGRRPARAVRGVELFVTTPEEDDEDLEPLRRFTLFDGVERYLCHLSIRWYRPQQLSTELAPDLDTFFRNLIEEHDARLRLQHERESEQWQLLQLVEQFNQTLGLSLRVVSLRVEPVMRGDRSLVVVGLPDLQILAQAVEL